MCDRCPSAAPVDQAKVWTQQGFKWVHLCAACIAWLRWNDER